MSSGVGPLTPADVALSLGVHMNTVKRIPPEELPFFRVGHRGDRRYLELDVERYVRERTVGRRDVSLTIRRAASYG